MTNERERHPDDGLLAAYAAGSLGAAERSHVAAHVANCPRCQQRLAEWSSIRAAAQLGLPEARPGPNSLSAVHQRIGLERMAQRPGPGFAWQPLVAQVPLVRRQIWAASALVLTLGAVITPALSAGSGSVLAAIVPVVAAAGVGFLYGPENDPPLEVKLATPTSPGSSCWRG